MIKHRNENKRRRRRIFVNFFVTPEPIASVTHSALDLFSSGQVLVNFQRAFDERVFSPTNADVPVLECEFTESKTDVSATVEDTNNIYLDLELQIVGTGTTLSSSSEAEI